jgi:alpha-ketoglutarate-dependent taurine dioxygenase
MALEFRALHGGFGAEVIGVDPTLQVDDETFRRIEDAWYRSSVLVFHDLAMTPEQQIAFARRLGPLHIMEPLHFNLVGHPEIFVVSNAEQDGKPVGLRRAGQGFHTDGEDKRIPNGGSFLYARQVPPEGGDTLFVDMYGAYNALPQELKRKIAGRRARFSRISLHHVHYPHLPPLTEEQKLKAPDVYHPLARRHPRTGRTSLYIGRWACDIEGMPEAEGRALVRVLQEFAQEPRFVYRHRWRVGDAVLWDNRCTQHCATGFDEARYVRLMHRATLDGEAPIMADDVPAGAA